MNARVRVEGPRGVHHWTARDLTFDGLFIESTRPYAPGTRLECQLELSRKAIRMTAEVRHQTNQYRTEDGAGPYKGMGLRFVRLGTDELTVLQEYLAQLTSSTSEG